MNAVDVAPTLQAEIARRRRVRRKMDIVTLVANGVGAMLAELYFVADGTLSLAQLNTSPNQKWSVYGGIAGTVALLILGSNVGKRQDNKIKAWYLHPENHSKPPSPQVQRLALQDPLLSALVSALMWTLAGIVFGLINAQELIGGKIRFNPVGFIVGYLGLAAWPGFISCILVYFLRERLWQPEIPLFFPEGSITHIQAFRMSLRKRVLLLFVVQALPLLLLAVAAYHQAYRITLAAEPAQLLPQILRAELFVVGVGMLSSLTLALTLGVSLIRSVEQLREQMNLVRQGNLNTQLPLRSNDEFGELAEGFNAMVQGLQQEEVIRRLFSVYVTPEVAEHAIQHGAELGGQLTPATVLFSDIRGFTSLTEHTEPDTLIAMLNRYFQAMSEVVTAHKGFVNKFGGDSLLAVFGTPLNPTPQHEVPHAWQAVQTARGMLDTLRRFNADQIRRGEPQLHIGIGIATGDVVAGNVGSEARLEYTVIGDTVNLASRLQTLTKELATPVLISAATAEAVSAAEEITMSPGTPRGRGLEQEETGAAAGEIMLYPCGEVAVRGKAATVAVYALAPVGEKL